VNNRRLLGVLVLAGTLLAVYLLWKRPDPFASRETVRAAFSDADGLAPIGADVRVAGVPVGRVTQISRLGPRALVTMSIDPSAGVVRRDAHAALRPRLMFEGTAYVQLTLGSPSAPALGAEVLPRSQTSTYVPFADVLSVLDPRVRGDVRLLARTAGRLSSGPAPAQLRDALAAAPELTADAASVARAAQGSDGVELGQAVSSLSRVSAAAASQSPALGSMLSSTARTAAAVNAEAGAPLSSALAKLPSTVASLRTGADAADDVATRARTLVEDLIPAGPELKPTIDGVRPLLRSAVPVLGELSPLLAQAVTAVRGAASGAAPALGAIDALEPTLKIFQNTLLSALEAKTDLGDPAYLAFLGLFAGGGGASRPFGVDGQGHFMRFGLRFLTGIGAPLPPCSLLEQAAPPLAKILESLGACTP
jgi:phospholipid/cholesterol/gamma-HCH transport system substrate-binding protein